MIFERVVDIVQARNIARLDGQVVTDELVELTFLCANELELHRTPIRRVELLLLLGRQVHQDVVADQIGLRELLSGGIHGLEDQLRVVHTALELHVDDDEFVETTAHHAQVQVGIVQLLPEVGVVIDHASDRLAGGSRSLEDRDQRLLVSLGQD